MQDEVPLAASSPTVSGPVDGTPVTETTEATGATGVPGRATTAPPALPTVSPPGRGGAAVQLRAHGPATGDVHAAARQGIAGSAGRLPFLDRIQRLFGRHDVRHVQAHTDGHAATGARAMGAEAYAFGEHVAFAGSPTLHTAAHEAAHVVQQRGGVQLKGGVGEADDAHERHADTIADRVVAGESVEELLDQHAGPHNGPGGGAPGIQRVIGANGHYKPVTDQTFQRYLARRTSIQDGVSIYRLVNLDTGEVLDNIRSDNATYDLALQGQLDGEITTATEGALTLRYAPGYTVALDLEEFTFAPLHVGDHVSFTLSDQGEVDGASPVTQGVTLVNDNQRAVDATHNRRVLDIAVQQQNGPTCWAATTSSIAAHYGNTDWTQQALIRALGQLADTNQSVTTALQRTGNLGAVSTDALTFEEVQQEINGGHPIIAGLPGDPSHVVLVCGYHATADQLLCIADPNYGGRHTWVNYRHFALGAVQYQLGLNSPAPNGEWSNSWTTRPAPAAIEMEDEGHDGEGHDDEGHDDEEVVPGLEFEALLDEALQQQGPQPMDDDVMLALLNNAHLPGVVESLVDPDMHQDLLPALLQHGNHDVADDILDLMLGEDTMQLMDQEIPGAHQHQDNDSGEDM